MPKVRTKCQPNRSGTLACKVFTKTVTYVRTYAQILFNHMFFWIPGTSIEFFPNTSNVERLKREKGYSRQEAIYEQQK